MTALFDTADLPDDLSTIPQIDLTDDLTADPDHEPWFRLGAWTVSHRKNAAGIQDVVMRKCFLLDTATYLAIADRLGSIGNVIGSIGVPGGQVIYRGEQKSYAYRPFYQCDLHIATVPGLDDLMAGLEEEQSTEESADDDDLLVTLPTGDGGAKEVGEGDDDTDDDQVILGEPLVFTTETATAIDLLINPDLWLFLKLEEKQPASGLWWDPKRGQEVIRREWLEDGNLLAVEIRREYLLKYLKARQKALVVGHYRHLHYEGPSAEARGAFVARNVEIKNKSGAKATIHSWQDSTSGVSHAPFLRRALHLWFNIDPPPLAIDTAFDEIPDFDISQYALDTSSGPVAPGRFSHGGVPQGTVFTGVSGDFLESTYFQQDVLVKYQSASGFSIDDNGSVHCQSYWGLSRSTQRHGNELISTYIGDFAEGVPYHEWAHWRQYAVPPPSIATLNALNAEQTIPDAVNGLVDDLRRMNEAVSAFATRCAGTLVDAVWTGSLDSLSGRQLKWIYPSTAHDQEFITRATLLATLVLDALSEKLGRTLLMTFGPELHLSFDGKKKSLGSRNLVQRLMLVAAVIEQIRPASVEIADQVVWAETGKGCGDSDLQRELNAINAAVRQEFAPLAFLYDLRNFGGLAHAPSRARFSKTAMTLGFAGKDWHRKDYLMLISLVAGAVQAISGRLEAAG
jgi:hypothetical protein